VRARTACRDVDIRAAAMTVDDRRAGDAASVCYRITRATIEPASMWNETSG
jgi:hypothetical protein